MKKLIAFEQDFGEAVLVSKEAKTFFRHWRKAAAGNSGSWAAIRAASFTLSGKQHSGSKLISRLRKQLIATQGGRCCYCRNPLDGIAYAQPIEHILPRHAYGQYTFSYRNLAVACFICNHVKAKDNWSTWPAGRNKYISRKSCEGFFHARLHDYHEHVRYFRLETNDVSINIYTGLTPQGRHLCEDLLRRSAQRRMAMRANPRLSSAMDRLHLQIDRLEEAEEHPALMAFMQLLGAAADPVS